MSVMRELEIKEKFANQRFTTKELFEFYKEQEDDLKETTFRWRVYHLKQQGVIKTVSRGVYEIGSEILFIPNLSKDAKRIFRKLKNEFPYVDFVIWETKWLNNFMVHQPNTMNIIIEVESALINDIFNFLYLNEKNIVLAPRDTTATNYMLKDGYSTIVSSLVLHKPTLQLDKFTVPKIEAIIVDLFIDEKILASYQGKEKVNIIENLFNEYTIKRSTIKQYASKRGVLDKVLKFLNEETNINF
ncbi:hypothetical protein IIE_05370 [Bacillus cereus VD045]|nr:hypothetical protein IIE_05370 [Bacillus cereus VD045]HDR4351250.1 hypothetical protein [Bacillus cereus]HDR6958048.1 hypothetical protein [Bacillus cereus]